MMNDNAKKSCVMLLYSNIRTNEGFTQLHFCTCSFDMMHAATRFEQSRSSDAFLRMPFLILSTLAVAQHQMNGFSESCP